ncbi:MAG: hypothetical protein L6R41_007762 [Letrouitia leprolyta]|nr:MAG: hypothetical protein L6R41_007762 [Letrouitia leprolyta]
MSDYRYITWSGRLSRGQLTHLPSVPVPSNLPPHLKQQIDTLWTGLAFPRVPYNYPIAGDAWGLDEYIESREIVAWSDGELCDRSNRDVSSFVPALNNVVEGVMRDYVRLAAGEEYAKNDTHLQAQLRYERNLRRWYRDTYTDDHKQFAQMQLQAFLKRHEEPELDFP